MITRGNPIFRQLRFWTYQLVLFTVFPALGVCGERTTAPFPNLVELRELYIYSHFEELDRRLTALQEGYENGRLTEYQVLVGFGPFSIDRPEWEAKLDRWVSRNPDSYVPLVARGDFHKAQGMKARGTDSVADTPSVSFQRMRVSFDNAIADYEKALSINPRLIVVYQHLITISKYSGPDRDKKRYFNRGLAVDPGSVGLHQAYLFSLQPRWGGSVKEMIAFLVETSKRSIHNTDLLSLNGYPFYSRAEDHRIDGDLERAESLYGRALVFGEQSEYLLGRANVRLLLTDFEGAFEDLERILEIEYYRYDALSKRAALHLWQGRTDAARRDLDMAVKLDSDRVQDLRSVGMRAYRKKNFPLASLYLDLAVLGGADDRDLRYSVIILNQAKSGPIDIALASVELAVSVRPDDPSPWFTFGYMLNDRKDCRSIAAMGNYLRLCEDRADKVCEQRVRDMATAVLDSIEEEGECRQ